MEYQEQVTGSPPGTEYVVDGVAFDGFAEGHFRTPKVPDTSSFWMRMVSGNRSSKATTSFLNKPNVSWLRRVTLRLCGLLPTNAPLRRCRILSMLPVSVRSRLSLFRRSNEMEGRRVSESLTVGLAWGPRSESAYQCAERLSKSVDGIPAQRDLFSNWLVIPEGGASSAADLDSLPTGLDGLSELVESSRLMNDRGEVMDGSGFSFTLARLHNDRPVKYRVRCNVENVRTGNFVQFDFPNPDHAIPATGTAPVVKESFDTLIETWQPDHASALTASFRKAQKINRRAKEIPVGWLTYVASAVDVDLALLPGTVDVSEAVHGTVFRLSGDPHSPDLDEARALRLALGYTND